MASEVDRPYDGGVKVSNRFIELYEQQRCLWDTQSERYTNKRARNHALKEMCVGLNLPIHENSMREVKKKIKHLRTAFTREWKFVNLGKKSWKGQDDIRESGWKWYKSLSFLCPHVYNRGKIFKLEAEDGQDTGEMELTTQECKEEEFTDHPCIKNLMAHVNQSTQPIASTSGSCPSLSSAPSSPLSTSSTPARPSLSFSAQTNGSRKGKKPEDVLFEETRAVLQGIRGCAESSKSQHLYFTLDVLERLNSMNTRNAFLARRDIDNILFQYMFDKE